MSVYYITGWKTREEYFAYMNSKDINHNAHIPARRDFYPPETKQSKMLFIGHKKKKLFCTQLCVVVWFLAFFILLSVVMTSLFLWQVNQRSKYEATPAKQQTQREKTAGCPSLPKPVDLKTLPEQLTDDLKTIEDLINSKMAGNKGVQNGIGALTANLVYRDKVIWSGAFGVLNKSEKVPRKPNTLTVFPCASVSKVITALLMYKLYDEKLITSLNEPITNFEPDFKIKNPFNDHKITLKDLASMRSGLQREAPCYPSNSKNLCPYSHVTMIERIQNLSLLVEPNTMSQYSNFGYGLLGQVLTKRFSQSDFNALVEKYVLKPLKMSQSRFSLQQSQVHDIPVAYKLGKKMAVSEWGWLDPAGGLFSTINDFAKLEIEIMTDRNKDRYLSKTVTDELFSTVYILPDGKSMTGTPWEMKYEDGVIYRDKGGSVYGYNVMMAMVPELRLAFNIMCTDCEGSYHKILKESFEDLIVRTMKKELRKASNKKIILPPDYQVYVGNYSTNDVPGLEKMQVDVRDNKLLLVLNYIFPIFYLNYTTVRRFRMSTITETIPCTDSYLFASENDLVIFDHISSRDGLSHGFTLFEAHPSGKSHFYRIPSKNP